MNNAQNPNHRSENGNVPNENKSTDEIEQEFRDDILLGSRMRDARRGCSFALIAAVVLWILIYKILSDIF